MFNSIRFKIQRTLDRAGATSITPGQWHEGSLFGSEEELLALPVASGEQHLIFALVDGSGQQEILDSWDWRVGRNCDISAASPGLYNLVTAGDEESIR